MDRMTIETPAEVVRLVPKWKQETTLGELMKSDPERKIVIECEGRPTIVTTAGELVRQGRISPALTLDLIEWAFSSTDYEHGR